MKAKRIFAIAAVFALAVVFGFAASAQAGTGLYYQAVDADNDPYSGIYLRNGTNMGNVNRVYSRYMYYGNTFELVCGTNGESVGPYNNRRWHKVYVINGPAAGQTGWIADRYANTPNKANQPTPHEPECDGNGNPPAPAPAPPVVQPAPQRLGAVYYSPYQLNSYMPSGHASVIGKSYWQGGSCGASQSLVAKVTPTYNANTGRTVTTLAGWSLGRLGPLYYLNAKPDKWSTINYLIIIDPGSYSELYGSCDRSINTSRLIRRWLESNPNAKLVIFAGAKTADTATATGGGRYAHRGIQEVWFKELRDYNSSARNRVIVCNYQAGKKPTNELHQKMFWDFNKYIDQPPISAGACPSGGQYWHP